MIRTESRLNKGLEIPERVANLIGFEYEEEFEKSGELGDDDYDSAAYHENDYKQSGRNLATGGEGIEDGSDFNNYFGLTKDEALDRMTQLHREGKIETAVIPKLESRIRRNLRLPKEYEILFKRGKWLM